MTGRSFTRTGFKGAALASTLTLLLSGCDAPGTPDAGAPAAAQARGSATPMSDARFAALPIDDQYRVANRLLGTLYSGLPVDAFYTLGSGNALRERQDPTLTLATLRQALTTDLDPVTRAALDLEIIGDDYALDAQGAPAPVEALYRFDQDRPKQMPVARMAHYPLSHDAFSQWMAWHLANTILFSPAEEIDSADITDVQNLFRRLDIGLMAGTDLRAMAASHMRSVQNWRRFRSPEDNTREMMEIWLGLFDNDADVPLASIACQDLFLTDERDGYKLAYTDFPNAEPVLVLEQYVTDCNDFYDVVASHPLLIPRVTAVLVDYFFAGDPVNERLAITEAIAASGPRTFEDIFLAILFSEAYLLDTERAKSFEESFLAMAKRLKWQPHPDMPKGLTSGRGALARADMAQMGWPTMSAKLGRVASVPLDSLSFGNYHKAMRESLMLDVNRWRAPLALEAPAAPELAPPDPLEADATEREQRAHADRLLDYQAAVDALDDAARAAHAQTVADWQVLRAPHQRIDDLNIAELIDYVMLSSVLRRADATEREHLTHLGASLDLLDADLGYAFVRRGRHDDVARLVLDYASRLPETYYFTRIR